MQIQLTRSLILHVVGSVKVEGEMKVDSFAMDSTGQGDSASNGGAAAADVTAALPPPPPPPAAAAPTPVGVVLNGRTFAFAGELLGALKELQGGLADDEELNGAQGFM